MNIRQVSKLLLLATFLCLPLACEQSANAPRPPFRNPSLKFAAILPEDWQHVNTYSLDTDDDGAREWIVLYRFDLLAGRKWRRSPIAAAVYQPDGESPPNIRAYQLQPPDGGYLCECECIPTMKDVLSGLPRLELVVHDVCDKKTTMLTIFHWDAVAEEYVPKGHFWGSNIEVTDNEVTVERRLPDRAQLAACYTCRPRDDETYYESGDQGTLVTCQKYELIFCHGEPRDVVRSPYPEKVVLAFYNHYDENEAPGYFTEGAWERLEQCAPGRCGCASARSEIEHVRVIELEPENETYGEDTDQATVKVSVACERGNGATDHETTIRWHLVREDDRWKLDEAELIPGGGEEGDERRSAPSHP